MLTDQWQGFAGLPDFPDPATVPTHLKNLFDFLASRAVPRYGTPADRDAELSTPIAGQLAWVDSDVALYAYDGTSWRIAWQDTGWMPLTLESGYTGGDPVIRRMGRQVTIQGSTVSGSFPDGSAAAQVASVPAWAIPTRTFRGGCYLTGGRAGVVGIGAGSAFVTVWNRTGSAASSLQFSLAYWLD